MNKHKGFVVGKKLLFVFLLILILIVVGIAVWVTILKYRSDNGESELGIETSEVNSGEAALFLAEDIMDKLAFESGYGLDQAVSEFKKAYDGATGSSKVYTAIEYANFVYDNFTDLDWAVEILENTESIFNEKGLQVEYYVALREIYEKAEDREMEDYYNQKINEILPSSVITGREGT